MIPSVRLVALVASVGALAAVGAVFALRANDDARAGVSDAGSLCEVRDAAAAGDARAAEVLFVDRAHEPLHELARTLDGSDRAQAARLLESKQRVEAAIEQRDLPPDLLDALVGVTDQSLRSLGLPGLECASRG